jgi:hypothetical protein
VDAGIITPRVRVSPTRNANGVSSVVKAAAPAAKKPHVKVKV